jgi:hypothetical protein
MAHSGLRVCVRIYSRVSYAVAFSDAWLCVWGGGRGGGVDIDNRLIWFGYQTGTCCAKIVKVSFVVCCQTTRLTDYSLADKLHCMY